MRQIFRRRLLQTWRGARLPNAQKLHKHRSMGLTSRTGTSHDGYPLSFSRAPRDDLARFVARFFVIVIDRPADAVLEDFLLHETAYVRVPAEGRWEAQIAGKWVSYEGPMIFGAQRKRFPVRCTGPIVAAGFALRPAAWSVFADKPAYLLADRLEVLEGAWGEALRWACENIRDTERTFERLEQVVHDRIVAGNARIDPLLEKFEAIARIDPGRTVVDIARELGMLPRTLDRHVLAHFGHLPKTVLRRSRFLDMAAVLRGLAVPEADDLAEKRFYDASHLNREFRLFLDMPPHRFRKTPTPLFTPGLELRQRRKLADAAPEQPVPWTSLDAVHAAE